MNNISAPLGAKPQKQKRQKLSSDVASSDFARALTSHSPAFSSTPETPAAAAAASDARGSKRSPITDEELEEPLIARPTGPPLKKSKKQNSLFTYGYEINIKGPERPGLQSSRGHRQGSSSEAFLPLPFVSDIMQDSSSFAGTPNMKASCRAVVKLEQEENQKRLFGDFEGASDTKRQRTATEVEVKLGNLQQEILINVRRRLRLRMEDPDDFAAGVGAKTPSPDQKQDGRKANKGQRVRPGQYSSSDKLYWIESLR